MLERLIPIAQLASLALQAAAVALAWLIANRSTHGGFWRVLAAAFAVGAIRRILGFSVAMGGPAASASIEAAMNLAHSALVTIAIWPVVLSRIRLDRINDDAAMPKEANGLRDLVGGLLAEPLAKLRVAARRLRRECHADK